METTSIFSGVFGLFIMIFSLLLFVATVCLPFYVYGLYTAARRIERRLDVLLQHTEMMVSHHDS